VDQELLKRLESLAHTLDQDTLTEKISDLEVQLQSPQLWMNPERAAKLNTEMAYFQKIQQQLDRLAQEIEDLEQLEFLLSEEQHDSAFATELKTLQSNLVQELDDLETSTWFSGAYDPRGAVITIRTGTGGVDAADWSSMLQRMYLRWAERHDLPVNVLDLSPHDEAGIKSVTFEIDQPYIYGRLKFEAGTHRLVRQSPFNSAAKRETSFSAVEVAPIIADDHEIELDEKDLRIDVYRSSGPGGQSVNTTDSAVRITHLPTHLVVSIQNQKSQLQNKTLALKILKSKLLAMKKLAEDQKIKQLGGSATASWGDQIRNYVLHPYKMVKDLRTNYQTSDVKAVLDGEIDDFIKAELKLLSMESNSK
jgi:peptide chain release factor 2